MKNNFLLLLFLSQIFYSYGQHKGLENYRQGCLVINNISGKGKDALDVKAKSILEPGEIYVYFHLENEDSIGIKVNDSLLTEKYIRIQPDRTGDTPDFAIKIMKTKKKNIILIYFSNDKSYIEIPVKKRYRVYQVSSWQNCIYVTMKKYYRFN